MRLHRRAEERGQANHGWLTSRHSFSFADYYDPGFMGFGALRVINDDRVISGRGFGAHPHRDMEILSYVVHGELSHKDSMGNGSVIVPGELQRMTAGTGVTHSEHNSSQTDELRFLQIWIVPEQKGLEPGYEQKFFGDERKNRLRVVASSDGREGSIVVHQDVVIFASQLDEGALVIHGLNLGRMAWIQVVSGSVEVGDNKLVEGDGLAIQNESIVSESEISIKATSEADFLLFDLKEVVT